MDQTSEPLIDSADDVIDPGFVAIAKIVGAPLVAAAVKEGSSAFGKWWKDKGPIPAQLSASWKEGGKYHLAIRFINATIHGAYIERIETSKPEGIGLRFTHSAPSPGGMSFGESLSGADRADAFDWKRPEDFLPLHLPYGSIGGVVVELTDDEAGTLKARKEVQLAYTVTLLGGKKIDPLKVTCKLREAGPLFYAQP